MSNSYEKLSGSHNAADFSKGQAAFVRHSAMFAGVSSKRCRIRASPWVVEAQVVAPVPHRLSGRGSTWCFRQQKKTPRLCAEVSELIY